MPSAAEIGTELKKVFEIYFSIQGRPLTVNGAVISKSPFFSEFCTIGEILSDPVLVRIGLAKFDASILYDIGKNINNVDPTILNKNEVLYNKVINYYKKNHGSKSEKPPEIKSIVTSALQRIEKECGIDGPEQVLFGFIEQKLFLEFLKNKSPMKDIGAGRQHGEYTHRFQWAILAMLPTFSGNKRLLGQIYAEIGQWGFDNVSYKTDPVSDAAWQKAFGSKPPPERLSLWDALMDRQEPPFLPFSPDPTGDARDPNTFNPWIIGSSPSASADFPLVREFCRNRFEKRGRVDIVDYLCRCKYGMSYHHVYKLSRNFSQYRGFVEQIAVDLAQPGQKIFIYSPDGNLAESHTQLEFEKHANKTPNIERIWGRTMKLLSR